MQTESVQERFQKQMMEMGLIKPQKAPDAPKEPRARPNSGRNFFTGITAKKEQVAGMLAEKIKPFDEVKFLGSEINLVGDGRPEKE